jgi:hypothetical protein
MSNPFDDAGQYLPAGEALKRALQKLGQTEDGAGRAERRLVARRKPRRLLKKQVSQFQ